MHVCDRREPTRGWADRALPGDGGADVPSILRALDDAGWDGLYDIEIFSDDGTFGNDVPGLVLGGAAGGDARTRTRRVRAVLVTYHPTPQEVEETR